LLPSPSAPFVEQAIELFAAIQFLVIGLSHAFQPHAWVDFFVWLRGKGHSGVFVNGFLSLIFGSLIVGFHNVWTGLPMVLTIIGWAQVLKALMSFVVPQYGLRTLHRVSHERAREFVVGGIVFLALSALMFYIALRR
jgi:hypothetical protein